MADIQAIVDQIKEMTLLEASELVKLMETTFGVSAAAAVAAAPAAAAAGGEAAAAAEEGCAAPCLRCASVHSFDARSV